jgi:hypothetical protein
VSSDGTFRIAGSAQVVFSIEVAKFSASLNLEVTHNSFAMTARGGLYVRNPFSKIAGDDWVSLSGVEGAIQLSNTGARLDLVARALGFEWPVTFTWGQPPPARELGMPRFGEGLGDASASSEGKALVDPLIGAHHTLASSSSFALAAPLGQTDGHEGGGATQRNSAIQRGRQRRDDTTRKVLHQELILEAENGDGAAGVALAGAASEELAIDTR